MTDELQPMDDDILKHLKAQAAQPRKHAALFTWYDRSAEGKGIAEAGAVDDLLRAMQAAGRSEYRSLGASGESWPDVWLDNAEGQRIPCEVVELVDASALPDRVSRPEERPHHQGRQRGRAFLLGGDKNYSDTLCGLSSTTHQR